MSKLKVLIIQKGYRQYDLARQLGWREDRMSRIVTGRRPPNDEEVTALAAALGVTEKRIREAVPVLE